jgi:hypothetical protein
MAVTLQGRGTGWQVVSPAVVLLGFVAIVAIGTAAGLFLLWPSGNIAAAGSLTAAAPGVTFPSGKIVAVTPFSCPRSGGGTESGEQLNSSGSSTSSGQVPKPDMATCAHLRVRVEQGKGRGDIARVDVSDVVYDAGLRVGEGVRLARVPTAAGTSGSTPGPRGRATWPTPSSTSSAAHRCWCCRCCVGSPSSWWPGSAEHSRSRGSPSRWSSLSHSSYRRLLDGRSGLAVGLVGASAIMLVVLYLAHDVAWS